MVPNQVFDQIVEHLADGRQVDWALYDSQVADPAERERLKWLQIVGQIAHLHQSDHESLHGLEDSVSESGGAPAQNTSNQSAQTWGRFRLVQKVGEGSFGSVYRAWDPQLEREIAIKILHEHVADSALTERLLREGRALARIRHTNVVSVLGIESHGGQIGLCMDFVKGHTLEDVLQDQGTFSPDEAMLIGQHLCRALGAVHQAGMVHRDVKARNVMREKAGRIVLMDFGTGRDARALRAAPGDIGGTPLYMAPEVLRGESASAQSDVYSLGVLLYHLVTGQYPVEAKTLEELQEAHRSGRRRFVSESRADLPPDFVRVVERAVDSDLENRYGTAATFLDALSNALELTRAEPSTAAHTRRLVTAGVALTLATIGALALGSLTSGFFNVILERSDFVHETVWDWWVWGLKAHVGPAVIAVLVFAGSALLRVAGRAVLLLCPAPFARLRVTDRARDLARRLALHQAPGVASWVLLLSSAGLVLTWWYFSPLMVALFTKVSMTSAETHALLSPAFDAYQIQYFQTLSFLVTFAAIGWYAVLRLATAARQSVALGMLAGGAAVTLLTLASLDFPYRLLVHNKFEVVKWNDVECYVLGERPTQELLFCPELDPPRNRVLQKGTAGVQRLGRLESVFMKSSGTPHGVAVRRLASPN